MIGPEAKRREAAARFRAFLEALGVDLTAPDLIGTDLRVAKGYEEALCAHRFLPFFGTAHVGYVPRGRIVGLSKLARVVEYFARRPQVQERLTAQVAGFLEERLRPAGTIVVVQARHLCMEMRGVGEPGASTTTSVVRGAFADETLRREFYALLSGRPGADESSPSRPGRADDGVAAAVALRLAGR